ncbi:MAG: Gfo/Idh/MocA family oxidoreductase [Gemmatimonadota bacterium]
MDRKPVSVGVIGAGGWGKNLIRNYFELDSAELRWVCDLDPEKRNRSQRQFPARFETDDVGEMLRDAELDAVVIATTGPSHHQLALQALKAGKDVYVEKPFTLSVRDARELVDLASRNGRVLMVGHLLEYHPVVVKLKELIDEGYLGDVRYIYSQRLNLGTIRGDENAMWNFAPHDISMIQYLLGRAPTDVSARGQSYLQPGIEDVVFLSMNFGDRVMGHVHVSWLDPHKTRRLTVVASQRMAVFDDLETTEKLKIYDKGAEVNTDYDTFAEYVGLRFGDITIPYIRSGEPLKIECEHFLSCVRDRTTPKSDGMDGLRVVDVLEAADRSLKNNGSPESLKGGAD